MVEIALNGTDVHIDFSVKIYDAPGIQNGELDYDEPRIESGVFVRSKMDSTNQQKPQDISKDRTLRDKGDWVVGKMRLCCDPLVGEGATILPSVSIGRFRLVAADGILTDEISYPIPGIGNSVRLAGYVCQRTTISIKQGSAGKPARTSRPHS